MSEKDLLKLFAPGPSPKGTRGPRRRTSPLDLSVRKAAVEIRILVRRDAELFAGDAQATEFLELFHRRIFDTSFDVRAWKRLGKVTRRTAERVAAEVGPLKAYLDKHRIRAAEKLVQKTNAPLPEIGRRVGFDEPRTFRRTFKRILGMTPQEMRAASREPPPEDAAQPAATEDGDLSLAARAAMWRRRITLGLASERQLLLLRREIRRLYPRPGAVRRRSWLGYWRKVEVGLAELPDISNPELKEATWPVAEALVYDETQAPQRLRPLFRELRKHLFQPRLTLDEVRDRAGAGERSIWSTFRAAVGRPPWTYVREARMEAAARLLGRTSFLVEQIGPLVGYTSRAAFGKAFAAFAGESPSQYRLRIWWLLPRLPKPPRGLEEPGFWETALAGRLDGDGASKLERYLTRHLLVVRSAKSARSWSQSDASLGAPASCRPGGRQPPGSRPRGT